MSDSQNSCPRCGAELPTEAPQGLCPKCLLAQASFPTEAGVATQHTRPLPPPRDALAQAFPQLEILELIGQGGMGFVYKARQPKLDRLVALKILAQLLAEQTLFAERFTREGRTLARLNHPNIVTIHDFGQAGPFFYLLMEFVDGVNLRQAMKSGGFTAAQALAIVPRICEALQYAHNEGVLHRDIKPDNILLDTRGRVKIADFGIAKLMAEAAAENPLTGSGSSLGTPHYMAPEQIEKPNAVDHRADIYSLGVVFYEMLTGELPIGRFAAPSEKSGGDPRLDELVFQTLEKHPDRRPQSAQAVGEEVANITSAEASTSLKGARCRLSTPEHLQSWFGRLVPYTGRGELRLYRDQLVWTHQTDTIRIPLRNVVGLSLGHFNRLAGIRRVDFISVTFRENKKNNRLYFVPNREASEWFAAIQRAAQALVGKSPPASDNDFAPLPDSQPPIYPKMIGKAVFATILFFILGFALLNLVYLSLRHRHRHQYVTEDSAQPEITGPTTRIAIGDVYGTNNQALCLEILTEPLVNQKFIPLIRYGDGPWGESSMAHALPRWFATEKGSEYRAIYTWAFPNTFNSSFELAAAGMRIKATAELGPVDVSTNITELFEIRNSAGQSISGGMRLIETTVPPTGEEPKAVIKKFWKRFRDNTYPSGLVAGGLLEITPGYRLQSIAREDNKTNASSFQIDQHYINAWWTPPSTPAACSTSAEDAFGALREIRLGAPCIVFAVTNETGHVYSATLELVPVPAATKQ